MLFFSVRCWLLFYVLIYCWRLEVTFDTQADRVSHICWRLMVGALLHHICWGLPFLVEALCSIVHCCSLICYLPFVVGCYRCLAGTFCWVVTFHSLPLFDAIWIADHNLFPFLLFYARYLVVLFYLTIDDDCSVVVVRTYCIPIPEPWPLRFDLRFLTLPDTYILMVETPTYYGRWYYSIVTFIVDRYIDWPICCICSDCCSCWLLFLLFWNCSFILRVVISCYSIPELFTEFCYTFVWVVHWSGPFVVDLFPDHGVRCDTLFPVFDLLTSGGVVCCCCWNNIPTICLMFYLLLFCGTLFYPFVVLFSDHSDLLFWWPFDVLHSSFTIFYNVSVLRPCGFLMEAGDVLLLFCLRLLLGTVTDVIPVVLLYSVVTHSWLFDGIQCICYSFPILDQYCSFIGISTLLLMLQFLYICSLLQLLTGVGGAFYVCSVLDSLRYAVFSILFIVGVDRYWWLTWPHIPFCVAEWWWLFCCIPDFIVVHLFVTICYLEFLLMEVPRLPHIYIPCCTVPRPFDAPFPLTVVPSDLFLFRWALNYYISVLFITIPVWYHYLHRFLENLLFDFYHVAVCPTGLPPWIHVFLEPGSHYLSPFAVVVDLILVCWCHSSPVPLFRVPVPLQCEFLPLHSHLRCSIALLFRYITFVVLPIYYLFTLFTWNSCSLICCSIVHIHSVFCRSFFVRWFGSVVHCCCVVVVHYSSIVLIILGSSFVLHFVLSARLSFSIRSVSFVRLLFSSIRYSCWLLFLECSWCESDPSDCWCHLFPGLFILGCCSLFCCLTFIGFIVPSIVLHLFVRCCCWCSRLVLFSVPHLHCCWWRLFPIVIDISFFVI